MIDANYKQNLVDIPAKVFSKFINNYEHDMALSLSEDAFLASLQRAVLRFGTTKHVWNGVDRLEKGTIAVIHLNDPTFKIGLIKIRKRRCEIQVPEKVPATG